MFVEYDVENDKKVISELIVIIGFICMISFEVNTLIINSRIY